MDVYFSTGEVKKEFSENTRFFIFYGSNHLCISIKVTIYEKLKCTKHNKSS